MRHVIIALALATLACGDPATTPNTELLATANLSIVAGADQADTIGARSDPIIVELTSAEGQPVPGVVVNFVVTTDRCGAAFAGSAITNASGRATERWDFGTWATACTMEVRAVDADGTPRVFGSVRAQVGPGQPVRMEWPDDPVAFTGEPTDVRGSALDREGNAIPLSEVTWTARGPLVATDGVVEMSEEAAGWLVGEVGAVTDSAEVWVLHDLGTFGDGWTVEHWTRFGAEAQREHRDCPATGFDATAELDSIYSTVTLAGSYHRSSSVLELTSLGDSVDAIRTTFWCRNGNVVLYPEDSAWWITQITDSPITHTGMDHRPHQLDGSADADGNPRHFDALDLPGRYLWLHGSTTEDPFRRDSTRFRPAN